jgi:hypothetical protein
VAGKLGKRPATHDRRDLAYASYAPAQLVPPATCKGNLGAFTDWGLLGNDEYGDCVFAGADH